MKIKKIFMLCVICLFTCLNIAYAQAMEITHKQQITCSTKINIQNVTISGQIENAEQSHQVTLLVGDENNIIYVSQTTSATDGSFEFAFKLPDGLETGQYEFKIGTDADAEVYVGTLDYEDVSVTQKNKFIDADVTVSISGYVPTISGTVYCTEGKTITVSVLNTTDDTVVANETITSDGGAFNLSYTLPSLIYPKEYKIAVSCTEGNNSLMNISAVIDSSVLALDVSGKASTASNVSLDARLQSVNTSLIDKDTSFSGKKSVSLTIPNIVASAAFELTVQGYETVWIYPSEPSEPEVTESTCIVNGVAEQKFRVTACANNVTSFSDKIYTVEYDENQVELLSLFGTEYEDVTEVLKKGNVNILSNEDGIITFSIEDIEIPEGKAWSGILNVFKFMFKSDYSGETVIKIKD